MTAMPKRIAILSHGHPELKAGGCEGAAYALFRALKEVPDVTPIFVARCDPQELGHDGWFAKFRGRDDEILWSPPPMDFFRLSSVDYENMINPARNLLQFLDVDVLHVQHYSHIGLDLVKFASQDLGIPTVMTIHEYMMICANSGFMLKTSEKLCYRSSPADCHRCIGRAEPGQFFARTEFIRSAIDNVGHFISPSKFLKQRFIDWGLDADRISVVENLLPPHVARPDDLTQDKAKRRKRNRLTVGFFGQLTSNKGIRVLFDAIKMACQDKKVEIKLVLFGANLDLQSEEFQNYFAETSRELEKSVIFSGSYRNEDIVDLMRSVDCVVTPSIWWENSPVVIQEALAVGVPVICSNIGGMAEKVTPRVDGYHFLAGSANDLATLLCDLARSSDILQPPPRDVMADNRDRLAKHLTIYNDVHAKYARPEAREIALSG